MVASRVVTQRVIPAPDDLVLLSDGSAVTQGEMYSLSVPASASDPLTVQTHDGHAISWKPTELVYRDANGNLDYIVGSSPSTLTTRGKEARYARTFPSADDVFIAEAGQLKHWVVLHEPPRAPASYLSTGVEFGVSGLITGTTLPMGVLTEINVAPFFFPKPVAKDLNGAEVYGRYEVANTTNGQQLFMWFPSEYLTSATYPVMVDPTIAAASGNSQQMSPSLNLVQRVIGTNTIYAMLATDAGIGAARFYYALWVSKDNGSSWSKVGTLPSNTLSLVSSPTDSYQDVGTMLVTKSGEVYMAYCDSTGNSTSGVTRYSVAYYNGSGSIVAGTPYGTSTAGSLRSNSLCTDNNGDIWLMTSVAGGSDVVYVAKIPKGNLAGAIGIVNAVTAFACFLDNPIWDASTSSILVSGETRSDLVTYLFKFTPDSQTSPTKVTLSIPFSKSFSGTGSYTYTAGSNMAKLPNGNLLICAAMWSSANGVELYEVTTAGALVATRVLPALPVNTANHSGCTPGGVFQNGVDYYTVYQSSAYNLYYSKNLGPWTQWTSDGFAGYFSISNHDGDYASQPPTSIPSLEVVYNAYNGTSPYTSTVYEIFLGFNTAPNAPTGLNRVNFDAADAADFTWSFSDPDSGNTQSAYQLLISRVSDGVTVKDTGKMASTTSKYTLPATSLTNPNQYQWQVRTWDQSDAVGPYSSLASFYTSAKPTVSITDPAADGAIVSTSSLTVQWSISDPESEGQSAYQVKLASSADAVLWDTGKVSDTGARSRTIGYTLANSTSYKVKITVWDAKDVKSVETVRTFTVSFTPPYAPTVSTAANSGYLAVTINNPPFKTTHTAPAFTGTGTGTITDPTTTDGTTNSGNWQAICTAAATNGGTFDVSVDGAKVGTATVGVAFSYNGVSFTINDGATDFALNDKFTFTTTAIKVTTNDLYRRKVGGATWRRIQTALPANGAYNDYTVASGVNYEYQAKAYGDNGTTADSASSAGAFVTLAGVWLHDVADPAGTIHAYKYDGGGRSTDWQADVTMMQFAGRSRPVAEFGEYEDGKLTAQLQLLKDDQDYQALDSLVKRKSIVCWRDGRGRQAFGVVDTLPIKDEMYGYTTTITLTEISYSEVV